MDPHTSLSLGQSAPGKRLAKKRRKKKIKQAIRNIPHSLLKLVGLSSDEAPGKAPGNEQEAEYWANEKKAFLKEDNFENFKNWPIVRKVPIYKDNDFLEHYIRDVSAYLTKMDSTAYAKWKAVLKEPFLGHSKESYAESSLTILDGIECTNWSLKSAHHVLTFEEMSGKSILDYDRIVEFGAGIGELARTIRDLGFKGDFYIYDLPEVGRISSFYTGGWAKYCDNHRDIPTTGKTLFIATWSLSEVPVDFRDQVVTHFAGSDFLVIFQNHIFEIDNQEYFINSFPYKANVFYRLKPIEWHHGGGGNFYLIGRAVSA